MAEGRYRLEPCRFATYSNILRGDGTRVGDMAFHTSAQGTAAVVELNGLLCQLEEARAEADRLRAMLLPIANAFAVWCELCSRPDEEAYIGEGTTDKPVTYGHMRQCCAALGIKVPEVEQ